VEAVTGNAKDAIVPADSLVVRLDRPPVQMGEDLVACESVRTFAGPDWVWLERWTETYGHNLIAHADFTARTGQRIAFALCPIARPFRQSSNRPASQQATSTGESYDDDSGPDRPGPTR
jgi:hypothetical protein